MTVTGEWREPAPPEYRHRSKIAVPGEDLMLPGLRLKWYDVRPEEYALSSALARESRERVRADVEAGTLDLGSTMGFVILHVAGGTSVGMLIVNSWRNCNEIWETVYLKDLDADRPYERYERSGHLPTYCVWELAVVWHERNAFERYLRSPRDAVAAEAYFADRFEGAV